MTLNIGKYDKRSDRKRGAVRMMPVILREDDSALLERVDADAEQIETTTMPQLVFPRSG